MRTHWSLAVLFAGCLLAAGCTASAPGSFSASQRPVAAASTASGPAAAASGAPRAAGQPEPTPAAPHAARKLILKAALTLQVDDVQQSFDVVRSITAKADGFIASSTLSEPSGNERTAVLELRVPADRMSTVLEQLLTVGKVQARTESGEDVTDQYVDLNSRLRNLRREEQRLNELLGRTDHVKDLLEVEREVTRVRGEIEQIQGRLQHLDDLVAYATITVTLTSHAVVAPPPPASFWNLRETVAYAWYGTLVVVRTIAQTAIYAVFMLPFALLLWVLLRFAARGTRPPQE